MARPPWRQADGARRCFLCETQAAFPGENRDPDAVHSGLRDSHQLLWSKPLPDGRGLLLAARSGYYLAVTSPSGDHTLGSDNFATAHVNALPDFAMQLNGFANGHLCGCCTIGGYIVFPTVLAQQMPTRVNATARRWSVNQARGMDRGISDRFDLTLEAIRLFYEGTVHRSENPIGDVLEAYRWWFDLFGGGSDGFLAFADFFFLMPMLDDNGQVRAFGPLPLTFEDALPKADPAAYTAYVEAQLDFVRLRDTAIDAWWQQYSVS